MEGRKLGAAGWGAVPQHSAAKPSRAWREILPGDRAVALQDALECAGRGRVPGTTREISMKKQVKKLVLAKETLLALELRTAVGGVSSIDVACGTGGDSAFPNYCPNMPDRGTFTCR